MPSFLYVPQALLPRDNRGQGPPELPAHGHSKWHMSPCSPFVSYMRHVVLSSWSKKWCVGVYLLDKWSLCYVVWRFSVAEAVYLKALSVCHMSIHSVGRSVCEDLVEESLETFCDLRTSCMCSNFPLSVRAEESLTDSTTQMQSFQRLIAYSKKSLETRKECVVWSFNYMMPKCSIKVFTHCTHPSDSLWTPTPHPIDYMQFDPDSDDWMLWWNKTLSAQKSQTINAVYIGITNSKQGILTGSDFYCHSCFSLLWSFISHRGHNSWMVLLYLLPTVSACWTKEKKESRLS